MDELQIERIFHTALKYKRDMNKRKCIIQLQKEYFQIRRIISLKEMQLRCNEARIEEIITGIGNVPDASIPYQKADLTDNESEVINVISGEALNIKCFEVFKLCLASLGVLEFIDQQIMDQGIRIDELCLEFGLKESDCKSYTLKYIHAQ